MKNCPRCLFAPHWHYARNVSMTTKCDHFMFTGCACAERWCGPRKLVLSGDREATETRWNAHAEELFAAYTARWTEEERTRFRAKLWPPPVPVIPRELFRPMPNGAEVPRFHYADADNPLVE